MSTKHTEIPVAELFAGVKGHEEEKSLKRLLLAFVVLLVTERTARIGGLYRRDYGRSHGTGLVDALILTTIEAGADLVTMLTPDDRNFFGSSNTGRVRYSASKSLKKDSGHRTLCL